MNAIAAPLNGNRHPSSEPTIFLLSATLILGILILHGSYSVASPMLCVKETCKTEKRRCNGVYRAGLETSLTDCAELSERRDRRHCRRLEHRTFQKKKRACGAAFRACRKCCRSGPAGSDTDCVGQSEVTFEQARSAKKRDHAPQVSNADRALLTAGNLAFALDLYRELATKPDNMFVSPISVSIALAMAYAGAAGNTAAEMAEALHFRLPSKSLHPAFNWLDLQLNSRGKGAHGSDGEAFRLIVVNAMWGQKGYRFRESYLDTVAVHYGRGMGLLDFMHDPVGSRTIINDWVAKQTEQRIKDLLGKGQVTDLTRLVLTNAVYFNAAWASQFEKRRTQEGPFHLLGGDTVIVPLMRQTEKFRYVDGGSYQAVELPYDGSELSMLVTMPTPSNFETFEGSLDSAVLDRILGSMAPYNMNLTFPGFKLEASYELVAPLRNLGVIDAFTERADFSGIDGTMNLLIADVVHKTFVSVKEAGTEAAAATGVNIEIKSLPRRPIDVTIDHPFLFFIRDPQTETIVFLGRLLDPSQQKVKYRSDSCGSAG